jgi:probable HAF family extracellular repeat protein
VTTRVLRNLLLVTSAFCLSGSVVGAQTRYRLVDLGQLDGVGSYGTGINESGVASAWLITATHDQRALRSIGDRLALVPALENTTSSAEGINARGDLAGSLTILPFPANLIHAMRYTQGVGVEDLGTLGGHQADGTSINRSGEVVGWSYVGAGYHAFLSRPGQPMLDLGTLGGVSSYAGGINDAGQVSGYAQAADGSFHAFLYTPGVGMRDLGWRDSYGEGINNAGQIAGHLTTAALRSHAFRYTNGVGFEDLDPVATRNSQGWAINDRGDVVGTFGTTSYNHAFVYTEAEGFVDLNSRVTSGGDGWILVAATGINSAGEIVGNGQFGNQGPPRAFKLIPEPPGRPLTALGPASIWVGLKNSDDVGIRFDLRAEVYRNGTELIGSGELLSVPGGSSGFNNARQHAIDLTLQPDIRFLPDDTFTIQLFVHNACSGSGKNSGTARLWYDDAAADGRVDLTIETPAVYYLGSGPVLNLEPGAGPKKAIDVAAGSKCSAFKLLGTWSRVP